MIKKELILKIISFIIIFGLFVNFVYADGALTLYETKPSRVGVTNLQYVRGNIYQYAIIDYRDGKQYTIIGFVIPIKIPLTRDCKVHYYKNPFPDLVPNFPNFTIDENYLWIIPICGKNIKINAISVFPPPKALELNKKLEEARANFEKNRFRSVLSYYFPFIYGLLKLYEYLYGQLYIGSRSLTSTTEISKGYEVLQRIEKYGLEIELISVTDKEKFSEFLSSYDFPKDFLNEIKNYNCNFVIAKFTGKDMPAYLVSALFAEGIRRISKDEVSYLLASSSQTNEKDLYYLESQKCAYLSFYYPVIYFAPGIYIEFETDKPWYPTKLTELMGIYEIKVYTNDLVPENVDYKFIDFTDFRYGNVSANALLSVKTGEDIVFKKYDFSSEISKINKKIEIYSNFSPNPDLYFLFGIIIDIILVVRFIFSKFSFHDIKEKIKTKLKSYIKTILFASILFLLGILVSMLLIKGTEMSIGELLNMATILLILMLLTLFGLFSMFLITLDIGLKLFVFYSLKKDFRAKIDIPIIVLLILPPVFYYIIVYLLIWLFFF